MKNGRIQGANRSTKGRSGGGQLSRATKPANLTGKVGGEKAPGSENTPRPSRGY